MAKTPKNKAKDVCKQEHSIIKNRLTEELLIVNEYIDKTESYTAITAPESSLGTILSKQKPSDIKLKRYYVRKRKIMYLLDCLPEIDSFSCNDCGKTIDLERLISLPKAGYCETCLTAKKS